MTPKLQREPKGGDNRPYCTLSRSAEAGFLALTHLPPNATVCTTTEGRSSLTDLTGPASILLTNWHQRPGLPLHLSELPRGENSTQGRSEACCCNGRRVLRLSEAHQLRPPCNSVNSSSSLKTLFGITVRLHFALARGCSPIEFHVLPSSWSVITGEAHRLTVTLEV